MFIIGMVLSLLSPIFGTIWGTLFYLRTRTSFLSALIMGTALASAFYGYIPNISSDINRHVAWLSFYRNLSLFECFDAGHYRVTYVWDIWCWFIALFDNANLMQASGAFLGLTVCSYMLFNACNFFATKKRTTITAFLLLLGLFPFHAVALNIRNSNSFIICCLAFFIYAKDMKCKLLKPMIFLVIAVLIHHSAMVIMALFFIWRLTEERSQFHVNIVVLLATAFIGAISSLIVSYLPYSGNLIINLIRDTLIEAMGHVDDTRYWYVTQASSLNTQVNHFWAMALFTLLALRSLYVKRFVQESVNDKSENLFNTRIRNATLIMCSTCIGLSIAFTLSGQRFLIPCLILGLLSNIGGFEKFPLFQIKDWKLQLNDVAIFLGVLGICMLHMYSLAYGTASIGSLLRGCFIGILNV